MTSVSDITNPVLVSLRSACRLGQIDFVNCLPITTVLEQERPEMVTLVLATPGELNRRYREGVLDVGAMSSQYFIEDGGFELIPNISISAAGAVGSVLFYARRPLSSLEGARIAVPSASASSVRLLDILLRQSYGVRAILDPHDHPQLALDHDGFLLFGDQALIFDQHFEEGSLIRRDLGRWWFETFRKPMVFGVWAARKSWIEENQEDFAAVCRYLRGSRNRWFGGRFPRALAEAQRRTGLSRERLEKYFRHELDYRLDESHRDGLDLYAKLCAGLVD